jgi:hypothetical protein
MITASPEGATMTLQAEADRLVARAKKSMAAEAAMRESRRYVGDGRFDQYPSELMTSLPFRVERALKTGIWDPLNMP